MQAMSSLNYQIPWDSVSTGGNELATSTSFELYDTIGQTVSGAATSTSYEIQAGYRESATSTDSISFVAYGQAATPVTRYGSFMNMHPKYVGVSSTVGFSPGDYIAAVQDVGYDGLAAIGRVNSLSGDAIVVDDWQGEDGVMSAFSDGNNDNVYRLSSGSIPFGTVTVGAQQIALAGGSVYSSATSGHTVYVQADGGLSLVGGGGSVTDVADGAVSSNAEEYGAEAIGPHAVDAGVDIAVTTTQRAIVSSAVAAVNNPDRFLLLFKLGVTSSTTAGTYAQNVYFTLTSNF